MCPSHMMPDEQCFSWLGSTVEQRWMEQQGAESDCLLQVLAPSLNFLVSVAGVLGAITKEYIIKTIYKSAKDYDIEDSITPTFSSLE